MFEHSCKRGHDISDGSPNLRLHTSPTSGLTKRHCKTCNRLRQRKYLQKVCAEFRAKGGAA